MTPFLLQYIATHTKGESLETNIALILHNAKAGAGIAVALAACNEHDQKKAIGIYERLQAINDQSSTKT